MSEIVVRDDPPVEQVRLNYQTREVWVNPDLEMSDKARELVHRLSHYIIRLERRLAMMTKAVESLQVNLEELPPTTMPADKVEQLKAEGWEVGDADDFLDDHHEPQ